MDQLFRCRTDSALYLICREGELERLPEAVRLRGPWDIGHPPADVVSSNSD